MLGMLGGCAPAIMRAGFKEIRKHEISARNARGVCFLYKTHNEMTLLLKIDLRNSQTAAAWIFFLLIFESKM